MLKIQEWRQIKNTVSTQTKYNSEKQTMQKAAKQNYPVQSLLTTLSQETRWTYSTTLPNSQANILERQSAQMSKITSDGLTQSDTECFPAVPI